MAAGEGLGVSGLIRRSLLAIPVLRSLCLANEAVFAVV